MMQKTDKFTAARIRLFNATGMAVQKGLPFDRLRVGDLARMTASAVQSRQPHGVRTAPSRQRAS